MLKKCFIKSTEEEGTRCGQLMANDKRVSVVLWGGVVIGNQSFYSSVGKKPVVGGVIVSPIDEQYKQGFGLFGSRHVGAHPVRDVREEHAQGEDRGRRLPDDPRHRRERRRHRQRHEEGRARR